ncbi:hypothetical protein D3C84_1044000 [compost metagenome]
MAYVRFYSSKRTIAMGPLGCFPIAHHAERLLNAVYFNRVPKRCSGAVQLQIRDRIRRKPRFREAFR